MTDITSLMESDTQSKNSPLGNFDDSNLAGVAKVASDIANKEKEIADLEEKLRTAKDELRQKSEQELPLMLTEMGLSSFKLADGSQVDIKPLYSASIPVANRQEAYTWLRDNGFGDMVKNNVSVSFGMGEDEQANEFKSKVEGLGLTPVQQESVHASTLKAWVKEQTEEGNPFPMELFGAYIGQRAVIKGAK